MALIINNQPIDAIDSLESNVQTLLQMIPDGLAWFDRMLENEGTTLRYATDEEFISSLLPSLRGTDLLFIDNLELFVSPKALYQMNSNDLRDFYHYTQYATQETLSAADLILDKNAWVSSTKLAQVDNFLRQKKIAKQRLFSIMTLAERIALYRWLTNNTTEDDQLQTIKGEAIDFALKKALNTGEFAQLSHFYMSSTCSGNLTNQKVSDRQSAIESIYQALLPVVEKNLDCPQSDYPLGRNELSQVINQWIDNGRHLGFTDMTTGLLCIAGAINLANNTEKIVALAEKTVGNIQFFLRQNQAKEANLSQDGSRWHYTFDNSKQEATVVLSTEGCLTVAEYRNT